MVRAGAVFFRLFLGALGVLASGCQRQEEHFYTSAGRLVTNSVVIPRGEYPAVVDIARLSNSRRCTGTFIRQDPPTLLTASHCLSEMPNRHDTTGGVVLGEVESVRACVPKLAEGRFGPYDLAVVVFSPKDLEIAKSMPIASEAVTAGLPVTLVAHGRTDARNESDPVNRAKRLGRNRVHSIIGGTDRRFGMIHLKAAPFGELPTLAEVDAKMDSGSAPGDSGGPLIGKIGGTEQVLGIVSGGRVENDVNFSYYVNLGYEPIKTFLAKALEPAFLKAMAEETNEPTGYTERCGLIDSLVESPTH